MRSISPGLGPVAGLEIPAELETQAISAAHAAGLTWHEPEAGRLLGLASFAAPGVIPALHARPGLLDQFVKELSTQHHIAPVSFAPAIRSPEDLEESAFQASLRALRHEAFARTALRELFAHGDVDTTAREWSLSAAFAIDQAVRFAHASYSKRHGAPSDEAHPSGQLCVLGMGKLAGFELNLGSDIDLCFFHDSDEMDIGRVTAHEHYTRVARLATRLLDEVTPDGFAYRVDLRLRPEGTKGALTNALPTAERYYETWGRPWERAVLLRATPIAGCRDVGTQLLECLKPFVFKRSVDPGIAHELARMLQQARSELLTDDARDLKLGAGGIREAEFFIQALQLIWGGKHPSLQVPNTLRAAHRLAALGLVSAREIDAFENAWALLRRVEHRVQVFRAYQSHLLPEDSLRAQRLALSLGYRDFEQLQAALLAARTTIQELFATLFEQGTHGTISPELRVVDALLSQAPNEVLLTLVSRTLELEDTIPGVEHLRRMMRRADMPLNPYSHARHPDLALRLLQELRDAPDPDLALEGLADFVDRLHGASRYLDNLREASPELLRGFVRLLGSGRSLRTALLARPALVDAVLSSAEQVPEMAKFRAELAPFLEDASPDTEAGLALLRRLQREFVLQVGIAVLAECLSTGAAQKRLSELAELSVSACFHFAACELIQRFGRPSRSLGALDGIFVCGLGSLAGEELSVGGDLDLSVVYEDRGETAGGTREGIGFDEFAVRVTQRAIFLLSTPHEEGPGYVVDARLRPSGSQGTLVVSLEAFETYHTARATHHAAAPWERQALLRCRPIAGELRRFPSLQEKLERLCFTGVPLDPVELWKLRVKMEQELGRESEGFLSLKYGPGSLVDIEFAVQFLQLQHASKVCIPLANTRNALQQLLAHKVLDAVRAEELLVAEDYLRTCLHMARLLHGEERFSLHSPKLRGLARQLGHRPQGTASAVEQFLSQLGSTRRRVRDALRDILGL